jgi:hypothetical protein
MRKLVPCLVLLIAAEFFWTPDSFGAIKARRRAYFRANRYSQAATTDVNRDQETWKIASDEFGCNYNLCNSSNPCNRGCKCRYPEGATIGYCVPWYSYPYQTKSTDAKEYEYKNNAEFMIAMTLAIVSDWNKQALLDHADPEFLTDLKNQDLDRTFSEYRKLGKVQMRKDAKISPISRTIEGKSVSFAAKMDFDSGPVEVKMSLVQSGSNKWLIKDFDVAPMKSAQNAVEPAK